MLGLGNIVSNYRNRKKNQNIQGEAVSGAVEETRDQFEGVLDNQNSNTSKNSLSFDVLDLSTAIDICAEKEAVDSYDEMMGKLDEGSKLKRIGGFFKRGFYRMGRDAWIDSKKRQIIKGFQEGLANGTYTDESLEKHVRSGIEGIENNAFLRHEEVAKDVNVPAEVQKAIDEWLDIDPRDTNTRRQKVQELKSLLEKQYPLTADLSQLESSLAKLEKAKIQGELETIQAKMNVLDIGRIENGYGERKGSFVVKLLSNLDKSSLPKWFKGFIQHPNTAAVVSALATRWGISAVVGAGATLGFAGGLLAPVALGSLVGGALAYGRAKREIIDRNAQIDRRGALGLLTGSEATDGKSVEKLKKLQDYQHSAMDLYNQVASALNTDDINAREQAFEAGVYYLVKHRVGHEKSLNMLSYDNDKSPSSQHVEMIKLLNQVFPGFVNRFNTSTLTPEEAQKVDEKYFEISDLADRAISDRNKKERSYAMKQGAIYTGVAAGVGLGVGAILHGFGFQGTDGYDEIVKKGGTIHHDAVTNTDYPDKLQAFNVKRDFWYDNGTPAPKFDYTELMVHTDKSGGWNITNMLGKIPFTNGHSINGITPNDFITGKIQAVITPNDGGPSFILPINEKGNIQIPDSMRDAFNNRTFKFLEIGRVKVDESSGNILLSPIATVKGSGGMIFDKVTNILKDAWDEEIKPEFKHIDGETPWYGIPFGGNRYHHLNKTSGKEPVGQFINTGNSDVIPAGKFGSEYGDLYDDLYDDLPRGNNQSNKADGYTKEISNMMGSGISSEEAYIKLHGDSELLTSLSKQASEMALECKMSINLPAYREGKTIYKALYEYSVKQKNKDGSNLDPSTYEINVLLNRPNDRVDFDAETEREVNRFKKDNPGVKVNLIKHTFNFTGKPKMGTIYKTLADLSLYRKNQRDVGENRMLIIRNGGADAMEKNKFFLSHIFEQFEQDSDVAVYKSESRYPRDVLEKLPLLHFMYTLNSGLNRLYTRGKSNIGSGSYRSDIYAFTGGFNGDLEIGEDIDLASRMRLTAKKVGKVIKKDLAKNAIDNPRRAIMSLATGIGISSQYKDYNSSANQRAIQEISSRGIDEIAGMGNMIFSKENLERNLTQLYQSYLTKVRRYSSTIRKMRKQGASESEIINETYDITNSLFSRMFGIMGITDCYKLVRRTTGKNSPSDARVEITNMSLISSLMEKRNFDSYHVFD